MIFLAVMVALIPVLFSFELSSQCPCPLLHGRIFVGREAYIEMLCKVIDFTDERYKVISIVGPPGVGKSTLALHIANEMKHFAKVCYIDLSGYPSKK